MAKCAFLGLGVMGFPMAGHLRASGHEVRVWNRTKSRAREWDKKYGPGAAGSPAEAVADADVIMICVGADKDVLDVVDAILPGLKDGVIVVDHTTASPACAREAAARLETKGVRFVDAPISGGQSGAEAGQLSIMCGGADGDIAATRSIMEAYGKAITHMGPVGAGQVTKCVNQICIAGTLLGLSEGVRFAQAAGLNPEALLSAIGGGAAQSWQMDNRLKTMAARDFDFGFAVDWMRKDLGIAFETAKAMGVALDTARSADDAYALVQALGGSRLDTSSLIMALDAQAEDVDPA